MSTTPSTRKEMGYDVGGHGKNRKRSSSYSNPTFRWQLPAPLIAGKCYIKDTTSIGSNKSIGNSGKGKKYPQISNYPVFPTILYPAHFSICDISDVAAIHSAPNYQGQRISDKMYQMRLWPLKREFWLWGPWWKGPWCMKRAVYTNNLLFLTTWVVWSKQEWAKKIKDKK